MLSLFVRFKTATYLTTLPESRFVWKQSKRIQKTE